MNEIVRLCGLLGDNVSRLAIEEFDFLFTRKELSLADMVNSGFFVDKEIIDKCSNIKNVAALFFLDLIDRTKYRSKGNVIKRKENGDVVWYEIHGGAGSLIIINPASYDNYYNGYDAIIVRTYNEK